MSSPAFREIRSKAGKVRWADQDRRDEQSRKMKAYWAALTPQEREEWIKNSTEALRSDEGRKAISDGTKEAYKRPEVKKNLSEGLKNKAWKAEGNEERRERARERANKVFKDPDVIQRQKAGHARAGEKISDRLKRAYDEGRRSRDQVSQWASALWAERKAKLAQLSRTLPADSNDKPFSWRVIGAELLATPGYVSNEDIAVSLDQAKLECPYGKRVGHNTPASWGQFISTRAGAVFMNRVRTWVGKPGRQK